MRVLFGIILGAALTVGVAYIADNWTPAASTTGSGSTVSHRAMVNWDVVGENMRVVQNRAREAWTTLSQKVSS